MRFQKQIIHLWNPGYSFAPVISKVNSEINKNPNFKGIRDEVTLLDKYRNDEVPLNIVKYKQMQKEIKDASKRLESFSKSAADLECKKCCC